MECAAILNACSALMLTDKAKAEVVRRACYLGGYGLTPWALFCRTSGAGLVALLPSVASPHLLPVLIQDLW